MADGTEMNVEAERAADLAEFAKWKGYPLPALNDDGNFDKDWLHREWVAFRAGRRRAAQPADVGSRDLPELPEPRVRSMNPLDKPQAYAADQMRQYARDAIAHQAAPAQLAAAPGEKPAAHIFGQDCPVGMVQVEFVGCDPALRQGEYGWRPTKSVNMDVWVDGRRFNINIGTFHDGVAERRGLHIVGPIHMGVELTSCNAASILLPGQPKGAAPTSDQQAGARLDGLVRYTGKEIATIYSFEDEEFFEVADVERILAAPAAIEQAGAQPVAQGWNIERNDTPEVRRFIINNGRNYRSITEDDEPTLFRYFATLAAPTPATDQDALDAKRYRWLRDDCPDFEAMTSYWLYDELDKKIDNALAATPVTDQPKQENQQ